MLRSAFFGGLALAAALCSSCASYRVPTAAFGPEPDDPACAVRKKAVESPLYHYVPRKRAQLRPLDARWLAWALAGNDDDGIFGENAGKMPYSTHIDLRTFFSWSVCRNPLHNLSFYVIGSASWKRHYDFSLFSLGGKKAARAFSNAGQWKEGDRPYFDLGFNDFKPYLRIDPWTADLFFGWRRNGSFEIKMRKEKPPPKGGVKNSG
ncbi:MAG: hypothetical protein ACLQVY_03280 [Limisphaerales bacterium]